MRRRNPVFPLIALLLVLSTSGCFDDYADALQRVDPYGRSPTLEERGGSDY